MQTTNLAVTRDDPAQPALPASERERLQRAFAEDGYLVFRNVVSAEKLAALRNRLLEEFERARQTGGLFTGGGLYSGHLNCFPGEESKFAYQALQEQGIIDLIKTIMPQSVRLPNVGCNFNLPGSTTQHFHVDRNFTSEFMIANVAVADTEIANGAIELVPGTHKKFYKYWRFVLERPQRKSVRVPLKQGDVLVRTSNLWHRGMPNLTTVARPMLAFTWEDGGSLQDDSFLVEEGKIRFRPNWFRPDLLGRLRERTFVAAPFTYSAWRIARSLFGTKGYDHQ